MAHESRLTRELRKLLGQQRTAALGTIGDNGAPFVSRVPFAAEPVSGDLVIHVSAMAAHTGNMQARPDVSLLVAQSEAPGEPVHALPRVTLTGRAFTPERDSPHWQARSEEHTSELQSLMRISYAVFCLQNKKKASTTNTQHDQTKRKNNAI